MTTQSYLQGYLSTSLRLDKKPRCTSGNKPCGDRCIPMDQECHIGEAKKPRARVSPSPALMIAASGIGISLASYVAAIGRYRHNLDRSTQKAYAQAEKYEVPETVNAGVRVSPLSKEKTDKTDFFSKKPAEQVTLAVNGFGGNGGMYGDGVAADLYRRMLKTHHMVGIENPEFDIASPGPTTAAEVRKRTFLTLKKVVKDGENEVAIRMAARAYAYHKKTGLPVNLVGYSGGGMATNEASEILKRMGVKDVRVVNFGAPHFGVVNVPPNSLQIVSDNDEMAILPGMKHNKSHRINSVHNHLHYISAEETDSSGEKTTRVNKEVKAALTAFFDRNNDPEDEVLFPKGKPRRQSNRHKKRRRKI